jgi:hypothetical protein
MSVYLGIAFILTTCSLGDAFTVPSECGRQRCAALWSTSNSEQAVATRIETVTADDVSAVDLDLDIADIFPMPEIKNKAVIIQADEIKNRMTEQLAKMKTKDQTSIQLLTKVCPFI